MPGTVGAPQVTIVEPRNRDWTIVRWCHKVADSVSSKFEPGSTVGKWLGRAVAAVFVPFGIIPSLVGDAIHGIRSLHDRHVEKKEVIEKKIPTEAEFEVLKAEKEALIKRLSAAEAQVKKEKYLNFDLNNHAESQFNALVRNAHEDQAVLRQQAELDKAALTKKANEAFLKEQDSKIRCIHRKNDELQARDAQIKCQSEKLNDQEQKLSEQTAKIDALQNALDDNVAKVEELKVDRDHFMAASISKELRAKFLSSQLAAECNRPWQDKYLQTLLEGMGDCPETGAVSTFTDGNGQDGQSVELSFTVPGAGQAEKRVVRLTQSKVPEFIERLKQLDNERLQLEESADRLVRLPELLRSLDKFWVGYDMASEYSTTEAGVETGETDATDSSSDISVFSDETAADDDVQSEHDIDARIQDLLTPSDQEALKDSFLNERSDSDTKENWTFVDVELDDENNSGTFA
ncbi:hypothetical protein [Endozoicomonas sp. SESOKO1]|uniref:hypothetical protein n=1 Tax=Endozoicomonas sp. SESOKO1 TaxID=2828742 RepID=UPI0021475F40|nr:hypothetical protein [Endozoicomonas sp. SESOKO1]